MGFSKRLAQGALAAAIALAVSAAAPPPDKEKIFQFALQNGMQVVVVPDHRAPVITQMLWYRVGAVDDPPGIGGLAHFFEHMMFRGTAANPGDAFATTVARNGGEDNAFTTHDYTAFYEQIAKDRMRVVMGLEADRIANLDLSDNNVRTEREVVLEERRMRIDNDPQSLLREQAEAALHLSHPYGRPVIGWPEEIRRIGKKEAQDFYAHHYAPNNCILVIAGDVTPDEARTAAEAEYGKLPARELVPRWEFAQPPRLGETRLSISRGDVKVPLFFRIYRVKSYTEAKPGEAESLETLAQALGGDSTSTLYRELVVEKKLASDAGASYDGYNRDAGEFVVYAVPRPGVRLEQVEKAADDAIREYVSAPPNAADFARAKTQLIAGATYRRDSQYERAAAYGQALAIGLTTDDVDQWPDRIKAVQPSGVRDAAARELNKREAVTSYLMPASSPEARK
ncbi:MAG TPA: pitrilysin family protein [Rhizomicrobium sp.]|jgi:zinc protease|nr:pitrilysin family protein [Rhizomicrobium sp.]